MPLIWPSGLLPTHQNGPKAFRGLMQQIFAAWHLSLQLLRLDLLHLPIVDPVLTTMVLMRIARLFY